MRNFTIGLIIVAGGTLAALPFRRTAPVQQPELESTPVTPRSATNPAFPSSVGMLVDHREPEATWLRQIAPKTDVARRPRPVNHEFSAPLRYEDLTVPITRPEKIEQRFSATEKPETKRDQLSVVQNNQPGRPTTNGAHAETLVRQSAEPNVNANDQTMSVLVTEPSETTTLASTPLAESQIERLPKKEAPSRERFWIRQP